MAWIMIRGTYNPKGATSNNNGCGVVGRSWLGRTIRCRCDNMAVVAILKSGSSKDERAMHLMRSLFFFLAS